MHKVKFQEQANPFFIKVKSRVLNEIKRNNYSLYAGRGLYVKAFFWLGLVLTSYFSFYLFDSNLLYQFIAAQLFSLSALFLLINFCHDVSHGSWSKHQKMNDLLKGLVFSLLGVNGRLWGIRHTHSHHFFPNVRGCDADIDDTLIIRLSPSSPYLWFHRFQHIYGPFIYSILAVHSVFYQDFSYLKRTSIANLENIKISKVDKINFFIGKIFYILVWIIFPYMFTSLSIVQIIIGYLLITIPLSYLFMPIGLSHLNDHSIHINGFTDKNIDYTFAEYQILSSVDFSPRNRLMTFLYGGLNSHAAHHLFPNVSHQHYHWISKIIEEECKNFSLPYKKLNFFELWLSHIRYLKQLSSIKVYKPCRYNTNTAEV